MPVVDGVLGLAMAALAVLALGLMRRLRADARNLMICTGAASASGAGFFLAHHVQGSQIGSAAVVMMVPFAFLMSSSVAISLYALLKTLWLFQGRDATTLKYIVVAIQTVFLFILCACAAGMLINLERAEAFGDALAVLLVVTAFHALALLWCMYGPTKEVIRTIEMSNVGGAGPRQKQARIWASKIRNYRRDGLIVAPIVITFGVVGSLLIWIAKSIPLLWAGYLIIMIQAPLMVASQIYFASAKDEFRLERIRKSIGPWLRKSMRFDKDELAVTPGHESLERLDSVKGKSAENVVMVMEKMKSAERTSR